MSEAKAVFNLCEVAFLMQMKRMNMEAVVSFALDDAGQLST